MITIKYSSFFMLLDWIWNYKNTGYFTMEIIVKYNRQYLFIIYIFFHV